MDEYQKLTKALGNLKKYWRFYQKKSLNSRDTKNHSIFTRNFAVPYYETSNEIAWSLKLENWKKNDENFQKPEKCDFCQKKLLKFVIFKSWNLIFDNVKFFSNLSFNPWWGLIPPGTQTTWIMAINFKNYETNRKFFQKMLNSMMAKCWKPLHYH